MAKTLPIVTATLNKIIGGGQAIATLESGQKLLVWGGLPDEQVRVQITKKRSKLAEGIVIEVTKPSPDRIEPRDPDSYLSTSPWQIMTFGAEQRYKAALIEEAYELHDIILPGKVEVYSDQRQFEYRNKVEFSWYWDKEAETLDLAFFRRGSHGKIPVAGTSLAHPNINQVALSIRDILRKKDGLLASMLKTVLIRCDQKGGVIAQLYVKELAFPYLTEEDTANIENLAGFELIYSDPRSPASIISKRLWSWGRTTLSDEILGTKFDYAVEGFFQVNLPVYEQTLTDMKKWVSDKPIVDLYSGVGTIGLSIGGEGNDVVLVESNESAVREMQNNITKLGRQRAKAILATSESALEYITADKTIIVDPPRAGLHSDVVERLLEVQPDRIIYLSCNPVTQARDAQNLLSTYEIKHHRGYNFFPKTPHIEHLVVLDRK